ncbi:MAG TPA: ferredoxin [Dysgonomonas sp.]|nr:ferredoxin [Dysgonomonas sp.]
MLRKIRIIFAVIFFILITLLFLDFTGTLHHWFGWMARIQLIPAILAVNVAVIVGLIVITLIFGRIYCSVICPLGIFQDGVSNISARRKKKKRRFRYSPSKSWLRYGVLALFVVSMVLGISAVVSILDPYAAYGRIASSFFTPIYRLGNNLLAAIAERADSYAFYSTEVWIKSWITFAIAVVTLVAIGILAWRHGRTYCNTICPVGTFLGLLSKYSLFRISFAESKCTQCKMCERSCKASCININDMTIDHSRCVTCFNCIGKCKSGGIQYILAKPAKKKEIREEVVIESSSNYENNSEGFTRRNMLTLLGTAAVASTVKAQQLQVDGGLADIEDKKVPERKTSIVPPGAQGIQNMKNHCTACQLCVSACPNNILRPSGNLLTFMQPEMSFERGYCRPECIECSSVCPNKAIIPITTAEKTSISIGRAVWVKDNCIVNTDNLQCTSCERHCPTGAVTLAAINPEDEKSLKFPVVSTELCIGCGACEHYCPARPFSAIYVEGNVRHHTI